MKTPRILFTRLASVLAVGYALLAFAAAPTSAQAQIKVVALDNAALDKLSKFVDKVNADADAKAAVDEMGKDQELGTAVMSGGSINDTVNTKYPKAAAVFKSGGYTPDEFNAVVMSLAMGAMSTSDGTSDPELAKKNIEFCTANKDKIEKMMASMH